MDRFNFNSYLICIYLFQPWTEYKRKFWRNALGDLYESPSQCYTTNTQALQTSYTEAGPSQPIRDTEDDSNIQRLAEFISRRNIINDLNIVDTEPVPESVPFAADGKFD